MSRSDWPTAYGSGPAPADRVPPRSVLVTAIILARDERPNIERAVRSVGWCSQVVVVDSGSTDGTPDLARSAGAVVWHRDWPGFAAQREWAMRNDEVANDWVLFLDADEWVPDALAREIGERIANEHCAAFAMRRRLVFAGRWIAHCGWYENSWQARLLDRRQASYANSEAYGERPRVTGRVVRLRHDFVDEDTKGLAHWLHKHVGYAELEASRRQAASSSRRLRDVVRSARGSTRPLARTVAKDVVYPRLPAKPILLFAYMYLLRSGWRDGRPGLLFCFNHAWYEVTVGALSAARSADRPGHGAPRRCPPDDPAAGVNVSVPRQPVPRQLSLSRLVRSTERRTTS